MIFFCDLYPIMAREQINCIGERIYFADRWLDGRLAKLDPVVRLLQLKYSVRRKQHVECEQRRAIIGPAQGAKCNHATRGLQGERIKVQVYTLSEPRNPLAA